MTLDELLHRVFPNGQEIDRKGHALTGRAALPDGAPIAVVGIVDGAPLTPADVVVLADHVLGTIEAGGKTPILVLVDTEGQQMSRHAEMIGLNEYCAHLAKSLLLASREGHRTIGLQYGKAAAGAFLATALATDVLVAIEGASPAVMDLPSIARVTKLPREKLEALAKTTPVFAPGLDPLFKTGAVAEIWDGDKPFDAQLAATLDRATPQDGRAALGKQRGGRTLSADVAARVMGDLQALARA